MFAKLPPCTPVATVRRIDLNSDEATPRDAKFCLNTVKLAVAHNKTARKLKKHVVVHAIKKEDSNWSTTLRTSRTRMFVVMI